jgi:hypothetical protein
MNEQLKLILGGAAPSVAGDTSEAAAHSIAPHMGRLCSMVVEYVRGQGARGATSDEVEEALDLRHQTASARLKQARDLGVLVDSGERRLTRSGRKAAVLVAAAATGRSNP